MQKYKGEIVLLLVAMLWGTGFPITSIALDAFTPFQIIFGRFFLSAIFLTVILHKRIIKFAKQENKLSSPTVRYGIMLGALLFIGFALQTKGLQLSTPSKNAFITSTNVIMVPFIGAIIYRRNIDIYGMVGAFIAMFGIGVISFNFDSPINIGDVLTLLCAVSFALHVFYTSEFMSRGVQASNIVLVQMITVCVLSFLSCLIFRESDLSRANFKAALSIVYMAAFGTTICFFAQTWAQKFTNETKAAIIMSMEAVFGALFSVLILSEHLSARTLIGCAMILCATLIAELKPGAKNPVA